MDVVAYSEEVHLYNDLAIGRVDAVLLDEPIALYYGKPNPALKLVGPPIGRIEYGIATRKEDTEFSRRIDKAVRELIRDGTLRGILERWGLWNTLTAEEWKMSPEPQGPATSYEEYLKTAWRETGWQERVARYVSFLPLLAKGALMTLRISVLSMVLAMVIGLFTALARLYGPLALRWGAIALCRGFSWHALVDSALLDFLRASPCGPAV
ncbi:MAG: transporter substrate-binding domain-containing protein [Calothrix sp. SM1_5_4]|nr:transporter substrate-binding domain-containing protein [Calothrix sp. SM1_5_4]